MIPIIFGFFLTLVAYLLAKPLNKKLPQIPVIVFGMCFVIALLLLLNIPYEQYMAQVNPVFNHLLGYVTVALAIPLAAMRYDDLPSKPWWASWSLPVSVRSDCRWDWLIYYICPTLPLWHLPHAQSQRLSQLTLQHCCKPL
jgi:uncharacterized membrane protein YhaH (DUF805 family)